ncbi:MAG: CDP-diacylglycerol--glycerol-3-phosphate 3-phosphatidyltransferase [Zetaproteobacteria bacterium CG02_land_8_20_14_3_00_50_9]|nr:MAG: CDP-diacylglycerol--glycerol-3-phosphate 3-phosphatidyltransferase [Zetaproteobacteria bacterium CG17_big_fil_post_rev_8_21_14_2_50_50_13]PIV30477.1 MAG: CDP-diacylglycerol--glycerol-3-phosphate 3-phosphatidyltransferase [Zetaproteobacteria bacterium CG02_land_8_20_14_3_00_50_9]PIY54899.1 MAG: CDP-diacylglycerol--glycerol-3-phosphate 3-phosphatidyltransferase [Zetaproteobacteria bacterium CG_4_10_14_0_8_um_filter_49_80]
MSKRILSLPNFLTLLRIVITPVIVYFIYAEQIWLALGFMIIAGLTDMLDGLIARIFNQRTTVGTYLDPIADKILLISLVITLYHIDQLPFFLFLVIVFRDAVIVVGAIAYEMVTHSLKIEPSFVSKATTLAQIVYVVLALLNMVSPVGEIWMSVMMWITFALTFISGMHYMITFTHKAAEQTD